MAREMKDSGIAWIGEIPNNWICGKCKMILSANDGGVWGNDPSGSENDKIVIRSTEQTMDGKWCIEAPARRDLTRIDYSKAKIEINDLLITKSSGSDLHIGKTTIADDYFNNHECYYSNFIQRIRCHDYNPKLLWYLFNSPIVREQCVFLQNTTSGIGNINAAIIDNLLIPIPPLNEQQSIIMILDKECARIDAVIERARASIEEYKKLKQAVITQAVTKGIRPNRPMKDSGVDWIGEIPVNWAIVKVKYVSFLVTDGAHVSPETENGIYDFISTVNIDNGTIDFSNCLKTSAESYQYFVSTDCKPCVGDVLISKDGTVGKTAVVREEKEFVVASSLVIIRPRKDIVDTEFLNYALQSKTVQDMLLLLMHGAGLQRVSVAKNANLSIVLPSMEEQKEIVKWLNKKTSSIDDLVEKKKQLINDLEIYKKSLIYEYVTGKREV